VQISQRITAVKKKNGKTKKLQKFPEGYCDAKTRAEVGGF